MYSISDLNGDGTRDVVCSSEGGSASASVLLNTGRQLFHTIYSPLTYYSPKMIFTADLNADGWPDYYVLSSSDDPEIMQGLYFGLNLRTPATQGAGAGQTDGKANLSRLFETGVFLPLSTLFALDTCDVNQDNYTDFVGTTSSGFFYLRNMRNNTFQQFELQHHNSTSMVSCYDMDGDSYPDIVGYGGRDSSLWWFRNNGGHNFTAHPISDNLPIYTSQAVADLNNDLRPGRCDQIDISTYLGGQLSFRRLALTLLLRAFLQI